MCLCFFQASTHFCTCTLMTEDVLLIDRLSEVFSAFKLLLTDFLVAFSNALLKFFHAHLTDSIRVCPDRAAHQQKNSTEVEGNVKKTHDTIQQDSSHEGPRPPRIRLI